MFYTFGKMLNTQQSVRHMLQRRFFFLSRLNFVESSDLIAETIE